MSSFLKKINTPEEAPLDSYRIYSLDGGNYYVEPKHYSAFTLQWVGCNNVPPLTLDLASARSHAIILDLDYKSTRHPIHKTTSISEEFLDSIESILKTTFLPTVPNFTYILAQRKNGAGIHIHLPEFVMGHDDYILLCQSLQDPFKYTLRFGEGYELDILKNAMLSGASKPGQECYGPIQMVYVDEKSVVSMDVTTAEAFKKTQSIFKRRKDNEKSLFRYLLNGTPQTFRVTLKQFMMPIVTGFQPPYTLTYTTTFGNTLSDTADWETVAFYMHKHKEPGYISKSKRFTLNASQLLKSFHHLRMNARRITDFQSHNHALNSWYKTLDEPSAAAAPTELPDLFQDLHQVLQQDNPLFTRDPNPLKTILEYNQGYYFLPVFYTLCQHLHPVPPSDIIQNLYPVVEETAFHPLLRRLQALDAKTLTYAISDVTLNTLHFCANHLYEKPKTMRDKLKLIIQNSKISILSVSTHEQMVELLRTIQEQHFPILVLRLRNALKKPSRYIWNFLTESWQEIQQSGEITDHMLNIWSAVKNFLVQYRQSGGMGGPDDPLISTFNLSSVVSAIMSDTNMERKDIQIDKHKWFIRLHEGTLDLLTGHIGGIVPEFFLSDRKCGIEFPRQEMMLLCNQSPHLVELYHYLLKKEIFLKYLRGLFLDETDTLYQTLKNRVAQDLNLNVDLHPVARSMLYFFINLCKYMSFEYDMILYLIDILASVLVGTNYERKFIVIKGLTRNGKSKLFQLMARVLGGYYHCIQSDNLTPTHNTTHATPELASTLFTCKMVSCEELEGKLNENRVKQLTGDSFVTFRNMYEQNAGGIPTAKLFASTNNYPVCRASEAFKDRVVAIPFDADFVDEAPATTAEQVGSNTYSKDAYVVEQSYLGGFFMLYIHFICNMNLEDGYLHYRPQPEYIGEFTKDYLALADIYVQFKVHMDVQFMAGCMTTMNDVRSAVRQFLKATKNTHYHETDLFIPFEHEFGKYRKTDIRLDTFNYVDVMDRAATTTPPSLQFSNPNLLPETTTAAAAAAAEEETEEPPRKRLKKNREGSESLVYYEGVVIKNLKRTNLDT